MPLASEHELCQAYRGDGVAAEYVRERFASELHGLLHDRQVAAVQRALNQIGQGPALEIAPGPGRLTRSLRPQGRLVCLEFNEGMIEHGHRACGPEVEWVRGNAFHLRFTD